MIFVTADNDRAQLEGLTKMLVSSFPGSTVYQHMDPLRVPHDALSKKVDAVFLAAEMEKTGGIELMQMLHRQNPELPVFILSRSENFREEAAEAGSSGYLIRPIGEQSLKAAVLSSKNRGETT